MAQEASRFVVGIDLGTTNSAVCYIDAAEARWQVHTLAIPQVVAPGEVEARDTLPSFHYEAAAGEFSKGALRLPWETTRARPLGSGGPDPPDPAQRAGVSLRARPLGSGGLDPPDPAPAARCAADSQGSRAGVSLEPRYTVGVF